MVKLPHPILAGRWKRLIFFFTTGAYLLQARTLADLVVAQEERRLIWQALRERALRTQQYRVKALPNLELDKDTLDQLLGLLQ